MVIDTYAKYDAFKSGAIGQDHQVIHIESTAAPNVLYEARSYFTNTKFDAIRFKDEFGSSITLKPATETVIASFWNGEHLARHLPHNYKHYDLSYNYRAIISAADLAHIFEFVNAETLKLGNRFGVKKDLAARIGEIKRLTKLRTLEVDINPEFDDTQVAPFMVLPPAVSFVKIVLPETMNAKQAATFVANQKVPSGWELNYANHVMQMVKVRDSNWEIDMINQNHLFGNH